jgi:hypothetical protein
MSRKAIASLLSITRRLGVVPATIEQKMQPGTTR